MRCSARLTVGFSCSLLGLASTVLAVPRDRPILSETPVELDRVGDLSRADPVSSKVLEDTIWIADWSFDASGGGCDETGWTKYDNRIMNDGSNYWSIDDRFDGTGSIAGNAAILAKHDLLWVRDGYGNMWDYSIILKYQGASTLTFDFLSDSEPTYDFVRIEADSAGASESRVDYDVNPSRSGLSWNFRVVLFEVDGVQDATVTDVALPDFGVPSTIHEAYIRFQSDALVSDQDGLYPSAWKAGLVVDNIVVSGGLSYTEDFESSLNANVTFANTAAATPFGEWARLHQHITDNEICTENTTCAWLFSDPLRTAFFPDMAFGPGSGVVRNWLDDIIVSPWVSLANSPNATGTVLTYCRFPGNTFSQGKIVQIWYARSRVRIDNTDTSTPGDSIDVVTAWEEAPRWNSLGNFFWSSTVADMSTYVEPGAPEIQIRFRVSDWQYILGVGPPATLNPGPGPYLDRVRVGRRALSGPVITTGISPGTQAQDGFPTYQNASVPGEHFSPTSDIWGTCAFSMGLDIDWGGVSPNFITGDSIAVQVEDVRGAGGLTEVRWYGAVTSGPHLGKAPAPYTVSPNGFFEVTADSTTGLWGLAWFVDLDDTYFRGGDLLEYFWTSLDAGGGRSSLPVGITATNFPPASVETARLATDGLWEVSYLPTIDWDPNYLARIQADEHGDLDPTPEEISNSSQRSCILYINLSNESRRSGETNRTSFMYTLDRLGYRDRYDVSDGGVGSRATVPQCSGYALLIHDAGRLGGLTSAGKVDQVQWYRDYLSQGLTGVAGTASLWMLGEDLAFTNQTTSLLAIDFGLTQVINDQALALNPNVTGQGSFSFANGNTAAFAGDVFSLDGGCPSIRDYDGALSTGAAVVTHRFTSGLTTGHGAVILNKNSSLMWNTIWMGFGWFDIRDAAGASPSSASGTPEIGLARKILNAALPLDCIRGENPTDSPATEEVETLPVVTMLRPNVPNPFNPATTFSFDLAHEGHVTLRVYDVSGRPVRTLVDGTLPAGWNHRVTWNGFDDDGRRLASGVYLCRLLTEGVQAVQKTVLLE